MRGPCLEALANVTAMSQTAGRSMSDDEKYERVLQKAGSKRNGCLSERETLLRV